MRWTYEKGLHDLGNGAYAWLAPDGSWGWSNAGLIVDAEESLLVDTLFDLRLTQEMLDAMRDAEPRAASRIGTLVNTHANGDHCHGNQLVEGAAIIASLAAAEEMAELPPEAMAGLMKAMATTPARSASSSGSASGPSNSRGSGTRRRRGLSRARCPFPWAARASSSSRWAPPIHAVMCWCTSRRERTVFTGDILFVDGTPIMWVGPVQNWIDACRRIEEMDVETVVPGHGPITDKRGAAAVRGYLEYIRAEARKRYDAGMDAFEAAKDIALRDYASWGDAERIAVNAGPGCIASSPGTTRHPRWRRSSARWQSSPSADQPSREASVEKMGKPRDAESDAQQARRELDELLRFRARACARGSRGGGLPPRRARVDSRCRRARTAGGQRSDGSTRRQSSSPSTV